MDKLYNVSSSPDYNRKILRNLPLVASSHTYTGKVNAYEFLMLCSPAQLIAVS
jgi:hypothetical protein